MTRRRSIFDIIEDWQGRCPPEFEECVTVNP